MHARPSAAQEIITQSVWRTWAGSRRRGRVSGPPSQSYGPEASTAPAQHPHSYHTLGRTERPRSEQSAQHSLPDGSWRTKLGRMEPHLENGEELRVGLVAGGCVRVGRRLVRCSGPSGRSRRRAGSTCFRPCDPHRDRACWLRNNKGSPSLEILKNETANSSSKKTAKAS